MLRRLLDLIAPTFEKGGRLQRLYPLWEAIDTFLMANLDVLVLGDYLLLPQERHLPAAGRIGALLDEDEGRLEISSCTSGSACEVAGLEPGDQILSIDGQPVTSMADLKLVMWDKSPGDSIEMQIRRKRWLTGVRQLTRKIVLQ